jgi:hypothetical protein
MDELNDHLMSCAYINIYINKPFIHFELKEHFYDPTTQEAMKSPIDDNDNNCVPIKRNIIKVAI